MSSQLIKDSLSTNKSSKLYSPRLQQLRDSIVRSKTKTQKSDHLPYLNCSQISPKKEQNLLTSSNRHLRFVFHQFCKQSYVGGAHATFDQIASSSEFMTLNKWMVFCKQFQITQKISRRELMGIFKLTTEERPQMDVFQFCRALQTVQSKSRTNPQQFVKNVLHVDSHASARNRMNVMKVNFSGPKTNFFLQSALTDRERNEQKKQFIQYKQKQRQYILHQGMFKEQIQHILLEKKAKRDERLQSFRNRSAITTPISQSKLNESQLKQKKQRQKILKQPLIKVTATHEKSKSVFGNYSRIFETKRISKTNSTRSNINSEMKSDQKQQNQSGLNFEQKKYNKNQHRGQQEEQMIPQINNLEQNFNVDSDAESDVILRSHYQNERKIKQNRLKESKIYESMLKQFSAEEQKKQELDQDQDDLLITRYN